MSGRVRSRVRGCAPFVFHRGAVDAVDESCSPPSVAGAGLVADGDSPDDAANPAGAVLERAEQLVHPLE